MLQKVSHFFNHKRFALFAIVVMFGLLGAQYHDYYKVEPPETKKYSINSDGCGYYAYLPQVFIYKTEHFEFYKTIQQKYPDSKYFQGLSTRGKDGKFDKYFIGTALCISPFFWTAHKITRISGGAADGYSQNYETALFIAGLCYWLLGSLSLLALLKSWGINRFSILFGIAGLTFATNLNFYLIYDPAFSHTFTFGIVCFFLLQTKRYADSQKGKHLIWILFLLGLITIIRPTNLLVALVIPFFFTSFKDFFNQFKIIFQSQKIALSVGLFLFAAMIFLQFLNIKSQYGHWGFNAYTVEGFDYILNPKIVEVLFGFRKGFFVYAPFMLLLLPGLWFLFRWNRYFFYGFLLFAAVFVYIMASWWCWYYGGSLGMRPLIDVYGILIIPVIILFARVNQILKLALIIFLGFMTHLNLIFNYQMTHSILHYSEMDQARFQKVFLQTDARFEWIFHTQNPEFDRKQYRPFQTFVFDEGTNQWKESHSLNKQAVRDRGTYIQRLVFRPQENEKFSDIAIHLNYLMQVEKEKSIPKIFLFGYRDTLIENLSVNFIGSQIPGLEKYYPVDAALYSERMYGEFDSLEIAVESGKGQGWIKNASCTFFKRKD